MKTGSKNNSSRLGLEISRCLDLMEEGEITAELHLCDDLNQYGYARLMSRKESERTEGFIYGAKLTNMTLAVRLGVSITKGWRHGQMPDPFSWDTALKIGIPRAIVATVRAKSLADARSIIGSRLSQGTRTASPIQQSTLAEP